jgi:8-oxo-dGTP pyrophosphatase MutT (NUDIX family)
MLRLLRWVLNLIAFLGQPPLRTVKPTLDDESSIQPLPAGKYTVVFCGHPCGGKSFLHEKFKNAYPEFKSLDSGQDEMDKIRLAQFPGPINDEPVRSASYRLMHFYASQSLRAQRSVALNATYMPKRHRAELAALTARERANLFVVQCVCDPNTAVNRFKKRPPGEHAASDLTSLRVRQLADQYERFDGALLVDTSEGNGPEPYLSYITDFIRSSQRTDPIRWANHEYLGSAKPSGQKTDKLSEASVRSAKRWATIHTVARWSIITGTTAGLLSAALIGARFLLSFRVGMSSQFSELRMHHQVPTALILTIFKTGYRLLKESSNEGNLIDWVHFSVFCWTFAGLATVVAAYFHYSKEARAEARLWSNVGADPRYLISEGNIRPSDIELFHAYRVRLKCDPGVRMPINNVPIYFVIIPQRRHSVGALATVGTPIDYGLSAAAAQFGLDWESFRRWRTSDHRNEYPFAYSHEYGLRCVNLAASQDLHAWEIRVNRCAYEDYMCTEQAVNLVSPESLPDMRRLLEGNQWDEGKLDLNDIQQSASRYSMRLSATVLILTADNFFLLQRRSGNVVGGAGNLGSSAGGAADYFADSSSRRWWFRQIGRRFSTVPHSWHPGLLRALEWSKQLPQRWDICRTALRETEEEIGLREHDFVRQVDSDDSVPPFERPCIGAAFNLLYGRDLNFYFCFRTTLKSHEICSRRRDRRTRDRWEVDNLVFLDLNRITAKAIREGGLDHILPRRSRHLLGALYAWAVYVGRSE